MSFDPTSVPIRSWGLPGPYPHRVLAPGRPSDLALASAGTWLPRGRGRSYGDVALNTGHALVQTRFLDRYIAFDEATGVLDCEAGVSLDAIARDLLPRGWFLPVVPGTRQVTVGGAIANDVHGKNQHGCGSFGDHVLSLVLVRSDGAVISCSRDQHAGWFAATIAGLGLTGLVTRARLQLRRVASGWVQVTTRRFEGLDTFLALNAEAEGRHEYVVAWIDAMRGAERMRGVLMVGDHATDPPVGSARWPLPPPARRVPVQLPFSLVGTASARLFNTAYWRRAPREQRALQPVWQYFWPLDALEDWNRLYGRRGLLQYQFVAPPGQAREVLQQVLHALHQAGVGASLAVLKTFGERCAPGLLSFARPGVTLALDFPDEPRVRELLRRLDGIVAAGGGALYPAKDAAGDPALFRAAYPSWPAFQAWRDPGVCSDFVRRMEAGRP